jgi:molybdopterin converting factor small subunit
MVTERLGGAFFLTKSTTERETPMEAKEMEKEGGNSSASKSWAPAEEAAIASIQESTGCARMQAIQKMRAGTSTVKHLKEMPLTDDQNKVLDQFEDCGRRWRKSLAEFVPIAAAVRKMFEDKPRGVTIRGCSSQDDYFDKHLGISGRTIRSMFAEMGKTDQRFANTTIELTDGDDGDDEETSKPPRKTKPESDQVKGLKASLKAAKEEIRDFEEQLADAPKKIEKLEAQVRGQEAETNKQAGKALDAEKALRAAKDEIASLKKTVQKLEAKLTKRDNLVTSQARTLDDLRKKLAASKNPPESRNNRKALIAARVEARKRAKNDPAFEAIEGTLGAANAEQIAVPGHVSDTGSAGAHI